MLVVAHQVSVFDREPVLPERQVPDRDLFLLLFLLAGASSRLARSRVWDVRRGRLVRAEGMG